MSAERRPLFPDQPEYDQLCRRANAARTYCVNDNPSPIVHPSPLKTLLPMSRRPILFPQIFSIQTRKTTLIIGSATSQLPGLQDHPPLAFSKSQGTTVSSSLIESPSGAAEDGGEQPAESAQAESVAVSELLAIFCNTSFWILITSHKVAAHKEIRLG
ncbi:hypothetical protein BLNAU_18350 [Blattamonas nauphoetae]|uniref:Uncharacterized protein n=1 Tax=Blattamonas nauphoetae TaxID=2049346 RepID=A0ABQ9X4P6_9EUKA|nr:hypothetical protein BLNAU_18350 [Blattamonas nauphoetae]